MPIPTPRDEESRNDYVQRCMRAIGGEETIRGHKATNDQKVAVCETTYSEYRKKHNERTILLSAQPLKLIAKGKSLRITGTLLRPGTWVGLDNIPTKYTKEFIEKVYASLVGKPLRFAHVISLKEMSSDIPNGTPVGFWTQSKVNQAGDLKGKAYAFNPAAVKYLQEHPGTSLSAEVAALVNKLDDGSEEAIDGTLTGGALIDDPACRTAEIETIREIALERGSQQMPETDPNNNAAPPATTPPATPPVTQTPPPATSPPPAPDPQIAELKAELAATKALLDNRTKEDISNITNEIKTYDKDFDSTKLLENVGDLPMQKKMLEVYLTSLKKHAKPIVLQLSNEQIATQVNKVAEEMFGVPNMTPEKILEIKEKK